MDYFDSILWEKSMRLAEQVVVLSRQLPSEERFGLRNQMTRAATSVPSNVAEGWVRSSWREKVNFLSIAHGSLAELHTQLILSTRVGLLRKPDAEQAFGLIEEIGRMLTALKRRWRHMPPDRDAPLPRRS